MEWTTDIPTTEGFYPYRSASLRGPTVIFVTFEPAGGGPNPPLQLVAYFAKSATPVPVVGLGGEFGAMIAL